MTKRHNHLIHETSPYLLQHAGNPVDWRAWNPEALELARDRDKPILLSIGYSACHWCHVMEHESFEDPETARLMNEHYVCIKVDREERPDLDKIYQLAHQMLTRRPGGWPLNVVIAPDTHAPFFAGTYFPDRPRHGMPSFREVLVRVAEYYGSHRHELSDHASAVREAFLRTEPAAASDVSPTMHDAAIAELKDSFDAVNGGFGGAPKFPHPTTVALCLYYRDQGGKAGDTMTAAREMAHRTLTAMARGGLNDQLGGGFYRYSVDASWTIPHFEKMLYDNAQLLPLYVDAWQAFGDGYFRDVAAATARWVASEMQSAEGGYYSTLDADSEGVEGKYYVWDRTELSTILSGPEFDIVAARFGLEGTPNFEGKWHLNLGGEMDSAARKCGLEVEKASSLLQDAAEKLLRHRWRRVRPNCDDKILTSWNGLMIGAMAKAGKAMNFGEFVRSAERALDYIRAAMWKDDRLLATARDGKAHLNAYLDDYVFLIDGILELCQANWRSGDLEFAVALADAVLDRFEDPGLGGLYFTSDDHEKLLHRPKPGADDAVPSGNGVAARVLLRLGHLIGENRYLTGAERILRLHASAADRMPSAHGSLVLAAGEFEQPSAIVIIRGARDDIGRWSGTLRESYLPGTMVLAVPGDETRLPGILKHLTTGAGTTAYLCRGTSCSPPIHRMEELENRVTKSID